MLSGGKNGIVFFFDANALPAARYRLFTVPWTFCLFQPKGAEITGNIVLGALRENNVMSILLETFFRSGNEIIVRYEPVITISAYGKISLSVFWPIIHDGQKHFFTTFNSFI